MSMHRPRATTSLASSVLAPRVLPVPGSHPACLRRPARVPVVPGRILSLVRGRPCVFVLCHFFARSSQCGARQHGVEQGTRGSDMCQGSLLSMVAERCRIFKACLKRASQYNRMNGLLSALHELLHVLAFLRVMFCCQGGAGARIGAWWEAIGALHARSGRRSKENVPALVRGHNFQQTSTRGENVEET